jgi:hypothetical protein
MTTRDQLIDFFNVEAANIDVSRRLLEAWSHALIQEQAIKIATALRGPDRGSQ